MGKSRRNSAPLSATRSSDPRIHPMTSVMAVEVAPDLKTCRAYISVLGEKEAKEATIKGLNSAEGYIRRQLARNLKPEKYTGDPFYSGRIYWVWCKYVKAYWWCYQERQQLPQTGWGAGWELKEDERNMEILRKYWRCENNESADISVRMVTALVPVWRYIYM